MMQNKVVGIISKPSSYRGDLEVKAVLPWLKKKSELLNGCDDGKHYLVSRKKEHTKTHHSCANVHVLALTDSP